ncbi:MAG TPA: response regulator transcription factor [Oculatellaceae cyanobacterium]
MLNYPRTEQIYGIRKVPRVLLVDDDPDVLEFATDALLAENFEVESATDGHAAKALLRYAFFDLLILDWNLPGVTGVELCKSYRQSGGTSPVMLVTANSDIRDKVLALDCGADDYLTKPFSMQELLARARAHLRRVEGNFIAGTILKFGQVSLDPDSHRVWSGTEEVRLLPKEFAILELFLRNPTRVFSIDVIIQRVWGSANTASQHVVRTYIKQLRQKLCSEDFIETVHSVGYRLKQ